MHYRHACHAGNFADVFKHVLLIGLIASLNRKPKPWSCLDTHAGAGHYDLTSADAARTAEWKMGVGALRNKGLSPAWIEQYQAGLGDARWSAPGGSLRAYPGSPAWVAMFARDGDRIICCDTESSIVQRLRSNVPEAIVHHRSGYESVGLLPPREKRGLVLVDPPYEDRNEWTAISGFLDKAIRRFATGIYAVWYPIKNRHEVDRFLRRCRDGRNVAVCEYANDARGAGQMRACGMLVINPPFGFAEHARETLACLSPQLARGPRPSWRVDEFAS